ARRRRALAHRPPAVVTERELEMCGGIGVLELEAALERPRRVACLAEGGGSEAGIEVRSRVVGVGLQGLEAAVAPPLGGVEVGRGAGLGEAERGPAALAEVVIGRVLDAARRPRAACCPGCHVFSSLSPPRTPPSRALTAHLPPA